MNTLGKHAAIIASGLAMVVGIGEMGREQGQSAAGYYLEGTSYTEHDFQVAESIVEKNIRADIAVGLFIWGASLVAIQIEPIPRRED